MCTLITAFQQDARFPVVVAANRDELYARPALGPRVWPGEIPFVAPKDEVAGGTWLGVNARGLFVGVTNRFGAPKDAKRESRGTLVVEALTRPSARALHEELARLSATRFNAFHLLYADARDAFVTWSDGETLRQQTLAPGVHIVTERSLGGDDRARTELIRSRLKAWDDASLEALMRTHSEVDPLGSICVHVPSFGYGTRSSAIVRVDADGKAQMRFADGPPCVTPYAEVTVGFA